MPETREHTGPLWLCVDCMQAAHGISEDERGEAYPANTLGFITRASMNALTPGMLREDHDTECPFHNGAHECPEEWACESDSFSWSPCDGCGSHLGGTRDAFTLWS